MDATTRSSLEVAEDVITEPLHDIHVRVRSRHALLHAPQINSATRSRHAKLGRKTYRQSPAARRDSLEEIDRRVLALPRVLTPTPRRRLCERAPDPF